MNAYGLTCSAGVSNSKTIAKIASDYNKPDGLTVIHPNKNEKFLEHTPVGRFHGIGKVTESKLHSCGIFTGLDLKKKERGEMVQLLGNSGAYYYDLLRGYDSRQVSVERIRKSIGSETTFPQDVNQIEVINNAIDCLSKEIVFNMEQHQVIANTVTLKVKYPNFQQITRSYSPSAPIQDKAVIANIAKQLLILRTEVQQRSARLIGLSVSNFLSRHEEYQEQTCIPF